MHEGLSAAHQMNGPYLNSGTWIPRHYNHELMPTVSPNIKRAADTCLRFGDPKPIVEGLENAPAALNQLFDGANIGMPRSRSSG